MNPDLTVNNYDSVVIIYGITNAGKEWIKNNVAYEQTWGEYGIVVEPRYAPPIIEGAMNDGLTVAS